MSGCGCFGNKQQVKEKRKGSKGTSTGCSHWLFFSNKLPLPEEGYLEDMLFKWYGDWEQLHSEPHRLDWFFPIFGEGEHCLSKVEAKQIKQNLAASLRVLRLYQSVLRLMGMKLVNVSTGEIDRHPATWEWSYVYINESSFTPKTIGRVLLSLGQLGFVRYKEPLVQHFMVEIGENGLLPDCKEPLYKEWLPLLSHDTMEYKERAQWESPADRQPSILFAKLEKQDRKLLDVLRRLEEEQTQQEERRQKKEPNRRTSRRSRETSKTVEVLQPLHQRNSNIDSSSRSGSSSSGDEASRALGMTSSMKESNTSESKEKKESATGEAGPALEVRRATTSLKHDGVDEHQENPTKEGSSHQMEVGPHELPHGSSKTTNVAPLPQSPTSIISTSAATTASKHQHHHRSHNPKHKSHAKHNKRHDEPPQQHQRSDELHPRNEDSSAVSPTNNEPIEEIDGEKSKAYRELSVGTDEGRVGGSSQVCLTSVSATLPLPNEASEEGDSHSEEGQHTQIFLSLPRQQLRRSVSEQEGTQEKDTHVLRHTSGRVRGEKVAAMTNKLFFAEAEQRSSRTGTLEPFTREDSFLVKQRLAEWEAKQRKVEK
ncbi:Opioid growth factor receptor-like protein 1 [Balamuthia mandrillaris]